MATADTNIRSLYLNEGLPYPFYMNWDEQDNVIRRVTDVEKPDGARPNDRLWVGNLDGKRVMIKFAQTYGKDVHEAWAAAELAPKVHMCRRLPGGWYVVVMEWLGVPSIEIGWFNMAALESSIRQRITPFVLARLDAAHKLEVDAEGRRGVLGDCQCQNVFVQFVCVEPEGPIYKDAAPVAVRFIDFDWAGVEGVQRYPPYMSPKINWPTGAVLEALIQQIHDRDLLNNQGLET